MKPILFLLASAALLHADTFPEIRNSEQGSPIPPAEALGKLRLPDGFQATLFASEPDVQNPIAATWDRRGRLWVAENYTYAERQKRFDLSMNDRVIILEDKDNDGKAETRKVFTDQVSMLTSVELAHDGVYLMCPPQLLFIPDKNQDDIPDGPPVVILDGFDVAKDNYHNFANGLRFGPDGWLYGRCGHACPGNIGAPGTPAEKRAPMRGGVWRYHPARKTVEVLIQGTTNPWGHDWDENGEMFFSNTVIGHIWHMIPGAQFIEPAGNTPNPFVYKRMDHIADHYHFDTTGSWQESRDGKASDFGGGHSHIGGMIYQADQWPAEYRGKYMTLNQHGRRVNVERIERHGSGYVAKHEPDIIFSDDPWFRGIDLTTGPDGSVFILDWSDTGECHDHTGVHRESGRIYKISHGKPAAPELSLLDDLSPEGVGKIIRHPNAWYFRQLQKLPPENFNTDSLKAIATDAENTTPVRLRARWLLHSGGLIPGTDTLNFAAEESTDEHLLNWALRLSTDANTLDRIDGKRADNAAKPADAEALRIAGRLLDPSPLSNATLIQRLPLESRMELITELVSQEKWAEDPQLPPLVWIGITPLAMATPEALGEIVAVSTWPDVTRWAARFLAGNSPEHFNRLLTLDVPPEMKRALMRGVVDAFAGLSTAPKPQAWDAFAASVTDAESLPLVRKLGILFGDTSTIESLKAAVLDEKAKMGERQAALDILIDAKVPGITELCGKVVAVPTLNGNALRGLAGSGDAATARLILANYAAFLPANRPALFDIMVARPEWAALLLDEIGAGKIPKTDLPAFSARRIAGMGKPELTEKLTAVWGSLNKPSEDSGRLIAALKGKLGAETLAKADLANGRLTYSQICSACHILYGEGGRLGPNLTGSGRANLDYLLENIVAPSAVVSYEYRMTTLTMKDGRTLAGNVSGKTDKTLTLRLPTGDVSVPLDEIASEQISPVSLMPEGLLATLNDGQVRDLIAYLMHPQQVPLPGK